MYGNVLLHGVTHGIVNSNSMVKLILFIIVDS